ncbi:MAG: PD-(D/E)XK nuclease family protein, partial [Lachnospiraceae bacterium]|nr:PD-(D/E)XK nuclease family protein [Lachnospiraceae bacterium]
VQGVIDVYFEENGKLVLMDYKTDKVDSADELIIRYKTQLDYYSEALSRLEKKEVAEIYIYSFSLEEVIRVI